MLVFTRWIMFSNNCLCKYGITPSPFLLFGNGSNTVGNSRSDMLVLENEYDGSCELLVHTLP